MGLDGRYKARRLPFLPFNSINPATLLCQGHAPALDMGTPSVLERVRRTGTAFRGNQLTGCCFSRWFQKIKPISFTSHAAPSNCFSSIRLPWLVSFDVAHTAAPQGPPILPASDALFRVCGRETCSRTPSPILLSLTSMVAEITAVCYMVGAELAIGADVDVESPLNLQGSSATWQVVHASPVLAATSAIELVTE